MTAAALVTPRPRLIDRLLDRWFTRRADPAKAKAQRARSAEIEDDLRTALEAASMCQVSALSAEYAHYLIDRHNARMADRG